MEVFTRYYDHEKSISLKWYTYYPAIELQLPIEVSMYYLLSMQTIDVLKSPLRFLLHSVLAKSCTLLGLSAYMLPRLKHTSEAPCDEEERRRRQRYERRNRARQALRRERYGFDHRTAEERLKDLRPRGPAPALTTPRIIALACLIWISLVCFICLLGFSSLWLGRTILRIVVRVKHPNGHDPLAVALGMGGMFFTFQILSMLCTNLSTIIKNLPSRTSVTFEKTIDVIRAVLGMIVLPLMCGCFLAWSALKRVSMPTLEDLVLGSLVVYGSTFSSQRIFELRPHYENLARNRAEYMMLVLTDTTLLRAMYHPHAWLWMEKWLVHSIFWSTFVFAFYGQKHRNDGEIDLAMQCGVSFRSGLLSAATFSIRDHFGDQIKSYARRLHKTLHERRYCIGWRLHNYNE